MSDQVLLEMLTIMRNMETNLLAIKSDIDELKVRQNQSYVTALESNQWIKRIEEDLRRQSSQVDILDSRILLHELELKLIKTTQASSS